LYKINEPKYGGNMANKKVNIGKAKQILSKTFTESCEDLAEDEIESMIVKAEQRIKEIKQEQEADEKLQAAKSIIKDLNAGYTSVIKHERARIDFLLGKLESEFGEEESEE
jgi:hypothetical protein